VSLTGRTVFTRLTMNSAVTPTIDDIRSGRCTLRFGLRGEGVRRVHRLLEIDEAEAYSTATHQAVTRFQKAHSIPATGLVDRVTFAALERFAPPSARELSPLTQQVQKILKSREYGRDEKISRIWRAFTAGAPADYAEVISELKDERIERGSQDSWVSLLFAHASRQILDRATSPFSDLAKAVILESTSACREAYGLLPEPLKRELLDDAVYEQALFAVAARPRLGGEDLAFMKELFRLRFPHVSRIKRSAEAGSPEWDADLLQRVYRVMRALPSEHLTRIQNLYRANDKVSDRIENGFVGGEFDAETGSLHVRPSIGARFKDRGMERVDMFDFSLRHEIGHAVDSRLYEINRPRLDANFALWNRHLLYYSKLPNTSGPNWQWIRYDNYYNGVDASSPQALRQFAGVVQEMRAHASPADNLIPAPFSLEDFVNLIYLKVNARTELRLQDGSVRHYEDTYNELLGQIATQSGLTVRQLSRQLRGHRIYQALTDESALKQPFDQGSLPRLTTFGDRIFVRSYADEFASFSAAAFNLRVRNYGARSPSEWFADTYALYYDPVGRAVLNRKHAGAITYLEALLNQFGLPLAR
jgi:hypothetical protein